jgi:hypothetical protein
VRDKLTAVGLGDLAELTNHHSPCRHRRVGAPGSRRHRDPAHAGNYPA